MQETLSTETCMTDEKEFSFYDLAQDLLFRKQLALIDELDFRLSKINMPDDVIESAKLKIYYIYYFMLDEREREYFIHIRNFIISYNNDIVKQIRNSSLEGFFDAEINSVEEVHLNKLFLLVLKKYAPELKYPDYTEEVLSNLKQYIYLLNSTFFDDFSLFQDNVLYGLCIGNSLIDYKKFLSPVEWDRFELALYNLFYGIPEFPPSCNDLDTEKDIEDKVDLLFVK